MNKHKLAVLRECKVLVGCITTKIYVLVTLKKYNLYSGLHDGLKIIWFDKKWREKQFSNKSCDKFG